ncbi:uncharacterized protein LOC113067521 [Carassius auratus]|uniref:Uncharacterized protein LOC113067521 n=1 Tax=Carassius auratus TaxID=7957 RepID=A0A6P6MG55_CARAU|nr:uncharacterized protein LOC113067521 [Carassius auratus]
MPYLLDTEFGKMFPGKADPFLRKWEGNIVPKLQKMSTVKNPLVMPTDNESEDSCFITFLPPTASGRNKGWAKCSTKSALANLLDIKATLMEDFERGRNMFEEVDTPYKMTKYFAENSSFIKPTEIFLGNRGDTARKQGKLTQVLIADTCQYISIIDTLKFLFDNEQMQKLFVILNESYGKLPDYCDGSHFKNHKLCISDALMDSPPK